MRIAVIGMGNVGGTLGRRWARGGHQVIFGSRKPQAEETKAVLAEAPNSRVATPREAAQSAEVVVLAVPWPAVREAISELGDLSGKTVVDATNPVLPDLSGIELGATNSAGEKVAEWARGAKVVKAFNTIGFNIMANPVFGDKHAPLFYCGDDRGAKEQVRQLASDLGFDPQDVGGLQQARYLEPLAFLWISLAFTPSWGREFAFGLLRR
ncbi:MAG TPA: NADPH-dependent F420 reductase [Bryobacteraceae bacterium]|nr:NADPH-dependent F420 reductase [Bryobacteraceae bacterium]